MLSHKNYKFVVVLLLCFAIASVFQFYLGSAVKYQMRRMPEPTFSWIQGIFNLPPHIGMISEDLLFADAVS